MLLAPDAGNINIIAGIFNGGVPADQRRTGTVREQTSDERGVVLLNLQRYASLNLAAIHGIIISCVVPPLNAALAEMARRYFRTEAIFVIAQSDTGPMIRYENPSEVGADRLVNGVAAFRKYGGPCVGMDLCTAITFDAVSRNAE